MTIIKNAWLMWVVATSFYAYQYVLRVIPNVLMSDILSKFNIDTAFYGQFAGIYYVAYTLFHIPIGIAIDRLGPKKIMPIAILFTVLGCASLIICNYYIALIIGRILIGIGSSASILGLFKIIRMSFDEKLFTRMLSIAVTIGLTGALYGGIPISYLKATMGFEAVVKLICFIGTFLAIITYLILPNIDNKQNNQSLITDILQVICNKKIMMICLFSGLMVGPLEGFADVWGTGFLKSVYNIIEQQAVGLTSMIFLGMCFGAPLIGIIAEKSKDYLLVIIICAMGMAACFLGLLFEALPLIMLKTIFIIIGALSSYQIIAIFKASSYAPSQYASIATVIANMIIMIFGYVFHSSIGYIIVKSSHLDLKTAYISAISVIPAGLIIALIGFIAIYVFEKRQKLSVI
jgi:predicted MFS family arabinose efflux permease